MQVIKIRISTIQFKAGEDCLLFCFLKSSILIQTNNKKGANRMAKFYIPDTELGFIGFPETISGFFKNMPLIPYNRETCGAID